MLPRTVPVDPRSPRGRHPRVRRSGAAIVAAAVLGIGLAGATEATAKTTLWNASTGAQKAIAPPTPDRVYDADGPDLPAGCARKGQTAMPLLIGWSGLRAPAFQVQVRILPSVASVTIDTRFPLTASTPQARVVCAAGALRPSQKRSTTGKTVSCGKKIAIGYPVSNTWPYIETAVVSRPNGKNGWYAEAGLRSYVHALCVSASAFKRVTTVRKTADFRVGATETTVAASCPGGRRPIAWGHEAQPLTTNTWSSVESIDNHLRTPFVSAAVPSGKSGWKVSFRTPDQAPAQSSAPLAVHLTCGVPA